MTSLILSTRGDPGLDSGASTKKSRLRSASNRAKKIDSSWSLGAVRLVITSRTVMHELHTYRNTDTRKVQNIVEMGKKIQQPRWHLKPHFALNAGYWTDNDGCTDTLTNWCIKCYKNVEPSQCRISAELLSWKCFAENSEVFKLSPHRNHKPQWPSECIIPK